MKFSKHTEILRHFVPIFYLYGNILGSTDMDNEVDFLIAFAIVINLKRARPFFKGIEYKVLGVCSHCRFILQNFLADAKHGITKANINKIIFLVPSPHTNG